ncbi:hypothetical protein MRX96_014888 [Rhipicephalus microplus]
MAARQRASASGARVPFACGSRRSIERDNSLRAAVLLSAASARERCRLPIEELKRAGHRIAPPDWMGCHVSPTSCEARESFNERLQTPPHSFLVQRRRAAAPITRCSSASLGRSPLVRLKKVTQKESAL